MRALLLVLQYVWAFPWTLFGLVMGSLGLLTGGTVQRRGAVFEFHGGAVRWFLERLPSQAMAMTIGFTVMGLTGAALDISRNHELIHVAQYGRWGPLFVPAYMISSLYIRMKGGRAYRDNPFEVEAYTKAPINCPDILES
jgi:hypothetical protein